MSLAKNISLVALGAAGAAFAINQLAKPSRAEGIASVMRRQMSEYNATVHPEQDRTYVFLSFSFSFSLPSPHHPLPPFSLR